MKGILIIGHGSRLNFNKDVMWMQAENLRSIGHENVYIGFNEMSSPSIEDALIQMADDGIDEIVAIPFFIASGLHNVRDIPAKLGIPEGSAGGTVSVGGREVSIHYETPFGDDPALTEVISGRVRDLSTGEGRLGVMIIGHGSRLGFNSDVAEVNADRLRRMGYRDVRVAFNEFNEPSVEDCLASMLDDGMDEIVAIPMFIASGGHVGEEIPGKLGIPAHSDGGTVMHGGKTVRIRFAAPIGEDPRLCAVLDRKIRRYYSVP